MGKKKHCRDHGKHDHKHCHHDHQCIWEQGPFLVKAKEVHTDEDGGEAARVFSVEIIERPKVQKEDKKCKGKKAKCGKKAKKGAKAQTNASEAEKPAGETADGDSEGSSAPAKQTSEDRFSAWRKDQLAKQYGSNASTEQS